MQETIKKLRHVAELLDSDVNYSINEIADRLGQHPRTVRRYIRCLRELGFKIERGPNGMHLSYPEKYNNTGDDAILHLSSEEVLLLYDLLKNADAQLTDGHTELLRKVAALQNKIS